MKNKRHCFLMVSCPSDVVRERELLKECVEMINKERTDDLWVELVFWATDTFSDAGSPAQESINKQILNNSDGLIAIFNARLGTPVHNYQCGTDEEMHLMLDAKKHVSLLFNNKPTIDLTQEGAAEQLQALIKYKNDSRPTKYFKTFDSESSFNVVASQEIRFWLRGFTATATGETDKALVVNRGTQEEKLESIKDDVPAHDKVSGDIEKQEEGIIDIIVNITNETNEMVEDVNRYCKNMNEFSQETVAFTDQYVYLAKAGKTQALQIACKVYAKKMQELTTRTDAYNFSFIERWKLIKNSLMIYVRSLPREEDRVMLKENIIQLERSFESASGGFLKFIKSVSGVPDIQKEFNYARRGLLKSLEETYGIFMKSMKDCDELLTKFNI